MVRVPDAGVTVTAINFWMALLPKLSPALTVIVSDAVEASSSVSVVRSASTCASVPVIVRVRPPFVGVTVPPPPEAPVFAASTPLVSVRTTLNVSPLVVVLPVSVMLTLAIAVAWLCATVAVVGAVITGRPLTVIAVVVGVATLPKLSVALTVMVSEPGVPSVSLSVPRAVLTCVSEPLIVTLVPGPETLAPPALLADSTPCVSATVTVNVSPLVVVLPLSSRLPPGIEAALPTPIVSGVSAVITGRPLTVIAVVVGVATLPKLSVALTVMVSEPAVPSVSLSVPRAVLTALSDPEIVTSLLPLFATLAAPAVTDSSPMLSATVTVNVSPLVVVLPLSARLPPGIDAALPTPIVSGVGAVITGSPFTVIAVVVGVATLPKLSVALTVMVSGPAVPSVSLRAPRAVLTALSEPVIVSVFPPFDGVTVAPAADADSTPLVSATTTVKASPAVLPL